MDPRTTLTMALFLEVLALCICSIIAHRSKKTTGMPVAKLDLALIPPVIGNLLIINSRVKLPAIIGYYIYFIGIDLVVLALIGFAIAYCKGANGSHRTPKTTFVLLAADAFQILLNPFTHHAFEFEKMHIGDDVYYRVIPHMGQYFHRVVDYTILVGIILIFTVVSIKTPKVYKERYVVILVSIVILSAWETYYIFTRAPVDRSMIGFGLIGVLVFYFSIVYRPLRFLDRMLSDIASDMQQAMFVFDPEDRCIWTNAQGMKLTCTAENELDSIREKLTAIFGEEPEGDSLRLNRIIGTGDNARYYTIEKKTMVDAKGRLSGSMISIRDNTEEQQRIKKEIYNSTHDRLTGLYTREYLYECIKSILESDSETVYLVIFIDVKNFKIVNDIFSSGFGDLALTQLADNLRNNLSERCIYGRLAGDTFGVLMPKDEFNSKNIDNGLSSFIVTDGSVEHHLLVHLGVYEVTDRKSDISVLFDRAHLAISTINEDFNTHIAYYDQQLREKVMWDQKIMTGLKAAISQGQLMPYLQPIADRDGNIVGAEALARWDHPEHGFMAPASFIPILEKNGQIVDVDRYIWRCACETLAKWENDMFLSVNISPKDFYFTDVVSEIKALVDEYGIPPRRLRLEVTETVMMNNADTIMATLDRLRKDGFIIEMDDFGSGYSSLNMLKEMPVDVLKIDMRFISETAEKQRARTIVKNIIRLSEELGIDSLTEGVETKHQFELLSEMGCELFQGYYFAKPMPISEFEDFAFNR